MKGYFLFMAVTFCVSANSQGQRDWQAPSNVKAYCLHTERVMVATFKDLVDRNRALAAGEIGSNPQAFEGEREATQRFLDAQQITWQRLGCASIVYGK